MQNKFSSSSFSKNYQKNTVALLATTNRAEKLTDNLHVGAVQSLQFMWCLARDQESWSISRTDQHDQVLKGSTEPAE